MADVSTSGLQNASLLRATPSGLSWFSKLLCLSTLFLIYAGGMVTSTGSGLAVPDWPLSYGMIFPPMIGGVFYEHGHRMVATFVGMLMTIMTVWVYRKEQRVWVRRVTFVSMGLVIVQGLLGGLTVKLLLPPAVSITHAMTAQTFFVLTVVMAYAHSRDYLFRTSDKWMEESTYWKWTLVLWFSLYLQLALGAVMRHFQAGLAIPDFPTMGGGWSVPLGEDRLSVINQQLFMMDQKLVSQKQVILHFLHRVGALVVLLTSILWARMTWMRPGVNPSQRRVSLLTMTLIGLQIALGIWTVLSGKHAIITSFHVMTGAALLGMATVCILRVLPWGQLLRRPA